MKHLAIVFAFIVVAACAASKRDSERADASNLARWKVIEQQAADIQACRDNGGIPLTEPSDAAWQTEYKRKLVRCEFPCDKRLQAEK